MELDLIGRIARACRTAPTVRDVVEFIVAVAVFAGIAAVVAGITGLAHWAPQSSASIALLSMRALFVPALGEELVFRAALIPGPAESGRPLLWICASTALFGLWHVAETHILPGSAATFLRADFLVLAMLLGLFCAILRYRSGSIWPAVALHWLAVVAWQGWFGGPAFGRG